MQTCHSRSTPSYSERLAECNWEPHRYFLPQKRQSPASMRVKNRGWYVREKQRMTVSSNSRFQAVLFQQHSANLSLYYSSLPAPSGNAAPSAARTIRSSRSSERDKWSNGVSTNGVTANLIYFDTLWVFPLAYLYLPKSARAYLFLQSVEIHYSCSGPISAD